MATKYPPEVSVTAELRARVARLEAANAAKDAALRELGFHARKDCPLRRGGYEGGCNACHAALPDKGGGVCDCGPAELGPHPASDHRQGWPEVREQARLAIGHAFHLIEHNKAMCVRCREAKQRLSAALDALGGE